MELLRREAVQALKVSRNLHALHAPGDQGVIAAFPDGLEDDGLHLRQGDVLVGGPAPALDQAKPVLLPDDLGQLTGLEPGGPDQDIAMGPGVEAVGCGGDGDLTVIGRQVGQLRQGGGQLPQLQGPPEVPLQRVIRSVGQQASGCR